MQKRFALFLVLSCVIVFTHLFVRNQFAPPEPERPVAQGEADDDQGGGVDPEGDKPSDPPKNDPAETKVDPAEPEADPGAAKPASKVETQTDRERPNIPRQRLTLGSLGADNPFRLLVTLDNRGATVERIELTQRGKGGKFRYQDLDVRHGYLGHLALDDQSGKGCVIHVVGPETPAALAIPADDQAEVGLRVGDRIVEFNGKAVSDLATYRLQLEQTKPGDLVKVVVERKDGESSAVFNYDVQLIDQPLSVIRPETNSDGLLGIPDPRSFMFSLQSIGDESVARGDLELAGLPSLRDNPWEVTPLDGDQPGVEFRYRLTTSDLQQIGIAGELEVVKRFRLAPVPEEGKLDIATRAYHLTLEVEIENVGQQEQKVAYRLDGPNGLPLEGWWYSNKIHPQMFHSAGARDVAWRTARVGHKLMGCSAIYKDAKEAEEAGQPTVVGLFSNDTTEVLDYIGVDTQYFAVAMLPSKDGQAEATAFSQAVAMAAGELGDKKKIRVKTTNATFRLISQPAVLPPGEKMQQQFIIFAGPKQNDLLAEYDLGRLIEYGWFRRIAQPLSWVLHFFEGLPLINYGLAIILLTVLVRSCMIPISLKAAKNAKMMQELAPEMKKLSEKYKNDLEKRGQAMRELYAKHKFNPFGGCFLMVFQLPVFIGLYRSLSVDIDLRQASLIPGIEWCSNLAGPDMLWYWKPFLPAFVADEAAGWLGPYLNILPIVTIVLFLVQQKMFMPPATDDQTRMQQKMMKFMMVFMGVLFFKVPAGLCVYFIASSLWGVTERTFINKPAHKKQPTEEAVSPTPKTSAAVEAKRQRLKKNAKRK